MGCGRSSTSVKKLNPAFMGPMEVEEIKDNGNDWNVAQDITSQRNMPDDWNFTNNDQGNSQNLNNIINTYITF
jgi:hypothetical protein